MLTVKDASELREQIERHSLELARVQRDDQMLLTTKIKIEVSEQDKKTLEFMQGKCRGLYNWVLGKLRDGEKWPGWKVAKKTLQESKLLWA
jgi:hypothetical protein